MRGIKKISALIFVLLVCQLLNVQADTTYTLKEITSTTDYSEAIPATSFITSNGNYFVYTKGANLYVLKKWENYQTHHEVTLDSGFTFKSICSYDDDQLAHGVTADGIFVLFNFLTKETITVYSSSVSSVYRVFCQPKSQYIYVTSTSDPSIVNQITYVPTRSNKYEMSQGTFSFTNSEIEVINIFSTTRGVIIVGSRDSKSLKAIYLRLFDRNTFSMVEGDITYPDVIAKNSCFNQKEGLIYVSQLDRVLVINIEDLDVPQYYYSGLTTPRVGCDASGEFVLFTNIQSDKDIINHHLITSISKVSPLLTLSLTTERVEFFEMTSATNLFAAMIKTGEAFQLRLYQFSLECDPSCKTCTYKCGCTGTNNVLVYNRGVCKSSCNPSVADETYVHTDKNGLNYCLGSCPGSNYFTANNNCYQCPMNCDTCSTTDSCSRCLDSRYLYDGIDLPVNIFRKCVSVNRGYYQIGGSMTAGRCRASCQTCENGDSPCSTCYREKQR